MGVTKQGLDCDYDRLLELVNEHKTLRQFLGHSDIWDDYRFEYQTVVDTVGHLSPALLAQVSNLVVEGDHTVARKKPGDCLRGRCDSIVVKTDVHYPTKCSVQHLVGYVPDRNMSKGFGLIERFSEGIDITVFPR